MQSVRLAGLLHDVGKIGLPDGLLDKAYNTLAPENRAQVMKHPVIGRNILMSIEKLHGALLERNHHELLSRPLNRWFKLHIGQANV